jgi:hypothetical protein
MSQASNIRRCEGWWIVRGRHGTGFHRYDALNLRMEEALERSQRLLPTVTDAQVQCMWEMMQEPAEQQVVRLPRVTIDGAEWVYDPAYEEGDPFPWRKPGDHGAFGSDRAAMPWPKTERSFTGEELRRIADAVAEYALEATNG